MLRLKNKPKTSQKLLIPFYHYVLIPDSFMVFYTIKIFTLSYFVVACTPSELFFIIIYNFTSKSSFCYCLKWEDSQ